MWSRPWLRLVISNVPFLLGLNAAWQMDAAVAADKAGSCMFWMLMLLVNITLWACLTWELAFPPRR